VALDAPAEQRDKVALRLTSCRVEHRRSSRRQVLAGDLLLVLRRGALLQAPRQVSQQLRRAGGSRMRDVRVHRAKIWPRTDRNGKGIGKNRNRIGNSVATKSASSMNKTTRAISGRKILAGPHMR
jgi:hypothetical protein